MQPDSVESARTRDENEEWTVLGVPDSSGPVRRRELLRQGVRGMYGREPFRRRGRLLSLQEYSRHIRTLEVAF